MLTAKQITTITKQNRDLHAAADAVLMKAADGATLSAAEITLLRSCGIVTAGEVDREVGRLRGIKTHQRVAGTAAERESLAADIAEAEAIKAEELPKLRAELESVVSSIQTKIDSLESAVDGPTKKLDQMEKHLQQLRQIRMLPGFVQDEFSARKNHVAKQFADLGQAGSTLQTMRARLQLVEELESTIGKRVDRHSDPGRFAESQKLWNDSNDAIVCQQKLSALETECKTALNEAEDVVASRQPEFDRCMAEVELTKDFYVM
ncbi:MAG: hypothetical protein MK102_13800 [Fuerstiella sp.]|nr:hypothetical protein [Fuerstiella sp.]